ncbi:flagellar protein FlaG [Candidatus Clostridium stratigraminis]|uniref:Flagellar protein FlaG n=1 Tax=Candidatus Clostridium stratigraminis TaxID=3381661 RepID=A0ABW8T3Y6_9CLOT
MEIGALGQGGQVSLNVSNGIDNTAKQNTSTYPDSKKVADKNVVNNDNLIRANEKEIEKAIDKINMFLEDNKSHAEYEIHDKFKDVMIKIVDDKTGDVIQELPPKKILDMVAKMCELVGVLFDKKA